MIRKSPANEELRAKRRRLEDEGRVQVITRAMRIEVVAPYHPVFIKGAKSMGGWWNADRQCWQFKLHRKADVLLFVRTMFEDK